MAQVSVRYIVDDVDGAVAFYVEHLGFEEVMRPGPGFAMLQREALRLLLNSPGGPGGAGQAMPDGRRPESGGWNRFQLTVDDLAATVDKLRGAGVSMRSGIIEGRGGSQVIVDDPAGNPVELFEPAAD